MNNLISVLMCVYNTPTAYLKEAVESIRNQTYRNLEFVIVDDASTDRDVIRYLETIKCEDDRITLIRNQSNQGLTKSLNIGLPYCHGKYIARMDSDDVSMPDRLLRQADYMEKHPGIALLGSNIIVFGDGIDEKDESLPVDDSDDFELYRIRSLIRHSGPPHPTFLFRSSFLNNNRIEYREDILKAQDYGIMTDIMRSGGKIRKLRDSLLRYRVHSGQITRTSNIEQMFYQWKVSREYVSFLFPILNDIECAAVAMLGCECKVDDFTEISRTRNDLASDCRLLTECSRELNKSRCYLKSIKKTIRYNRDKGLFDNHLLAAVLRYELWKKCLRTTKQYGRPWGLWPYTLLGYIYVRCGNSTLPN